MFINLVGEVGEIASKVAKPIRKEDAFIDNNQLDISEENKEAIKLECGDVLWQLAGLCKMFGWELEDVAQAVLDKLSSRKERNTIDGNGDYR